MKNKIIFWLNADFTIFALARGIQQKYDADFYAVIDITNKPKDFFINQKLIQFKKIWFYHDFIDVKKPADLEYLQQFEEKYKINLWLYAYNERLFYNYNEFFHFTSEQVLSILEQECKLFESIIDEIRPNFLIMFNTMTHYEHLFYEICVRKQVIPLILNDTRLGRRWTVSSIPDEIDSMPSSFEGKTNLKTFEQIQSVRDNFDIHKAMRNWDSKFLKSKSRMIVAAAKYLLSNDLDNRKTHYTYFGRTKLKIILTYVKYFFIEKYRTYFLKKNFLNEIPNEKFIYFALAAEPERTILLKSPFHTNQIEVIENIVKSLPVGYRLYVKEHPAMNSRGWRKTSYYKQLMKMPNIRLIHPYVKFDDVIKKSSLVIAVSGTAGFEAALFNKPSIVLTDTSYVALSSVARLKSLEDLPVTIRASLTKQVNPLELGEYVEKIIDNTCEADCYRFKSEFSEQFYYRGFLVDVSISEDAVKSFLDTHNELIDSIIVEFLKKLILDNHK